MADTLLRKVKVTDDIGVEVYLQGKRKYTLIIDGDEITKSNKLNYSNDDYVVIEKSLEDYARVNKKPIDYYKIIQDPYKDVENEQIEEDLDNVYISDRERIESEEKKEKIKLEIEIPYTTSDELVVKEKTDLDVFIVWGGKIPKTFGLFDQFYGEDELLDEFKEVSYFGMEEELFEVVYEKEIYSIEESGLMDMEDVDIAGGVDSATVINPNKIGSAMATDSPVYKKTKFDAGKMQSAKEVLKYLNKKDGVVEVGDSKTDGTYFSAYMDTAKKFDGKYYLQESAGKAFIAWANFMKKAKIPFLVSSALRFGGSTGAGPHGYGISVDFSNLYQLAGGGTDLKTNRNIRISSEVYKKIAKSGTKFGFYNPWRLSNNAGTMDEVWHFEYWGP